MTGTIKKMMIPLAMTLAGGIAFGADVGVAQTNLYPTERAEWPAFSTVDAVVAHYGPHVRPKLKRLCEAQNVAYPPEKMTWVCLKREKQLYVFAPDKKGVVKKILAYPVIGLSGAAGPKLKEGDKQVPEGFYRLSDFRPRLVAHIGMGVDYPNAEDRLHARQEKRKNLGSDILIHGSQWSSGCLAMGNPAISELFVLTRDSGLDAVELIFAPCNLAANATSALVLAPTYQRLTWLPDLYKRIKARLARLPL